MICRKKNKNLSLNVVADLKNINPSLKEEQLHNFILKAYPKPDGISTEEYNENIKNLVLEAFKGFKQSKTNKNKQAEDISNLYKTKPNIRPKDDGIFFDSDEVNKKQAEWDKLYKGKLDPDTGLPIDKKRRNR